MKNYLCNIYMKKETQREREKPFKSIYQYTFTNCNYYVSKDDAIFCSL